MLNGPIESIAGAAMILGATSLASKILGVLRNRILAGLFGAGDVLDSYYAAFRFPDLIFNLVVLGALSAGFIPIFAELLERRKKTNQDGQTSYGIGPWEFTASVFNLTLVALAALSLFFVVFADKIIPLMTPGFSPAKQAMTVMLSRWMALSPILLGVSAVFSGVLQTYRYFLIYSLAPLFYNLGIIAGAWFLTPIFGPVGLAFGVIAGAFLHMAIQMPPSLALGFRFSRLFYLKDEAIKKIGKLMVPRVLSLAVSQFNFLAMTFVGSVLASGSIAIFNFANDIQSFPLGLFSISLAVAAFPALSALAAARDKENFRRSFQKTASLILFLTVPAALLLLLLRAQIVRVLLGWGQFDWSDTIGTADTVAFFSLSLFAQGLLPLLARAFYALHDTWRPFLISLFSSLVNIVLAFWLRDLMGVAGLALAFSVGAVLNAALLWIFLRFKIGPLGESELVWSILKLSGAIVVMAAAVQLMKNLVAPLVDMRAFWGVFVQGFVATVVGLGVFILLSWLFKNKEMLFLVDSFRRKFFKKKEVKGLEEEGGVGSV
ncbi:MAG: murein biosynthesis integral membrane protein MurJ [bacterium]|nr:murein biosynthesis integral membrane protein MurJ [bacterium]